MYHVFLDKLVGDREVHKFEKFDGALIFGNCALGGQNIKSVHIYAHGTGRILAQGYEGDDRLE